MVGIKERLEVNNESCVIVEFSNENNNCATGFSCWLKPNVSAEEISEHIAMKKELVIYSPKCDKKEASKMKNTLISLPDADLDVCTVRILEALVRNHHWIKITWEQSKVILIDYSVKPERIYNCVLVSDNTIHEVKDMWSDKKQNETGS